MTTAISLPTSSLCTMPCDIIRIISIVNIINIGNIVYN